MLGVYTSDRGEWTPIIVAGNWRVNTGNVGRVYTGNWGEWMQVIYGQSQQRWLERANADNIEKIYR